MSKRRCKKRDMTMRKTEVTQYDRDGKMIETFDSIQKAADEAGVDKSNISACIKGKRRSAGGFFWSTGQFEPPEPDGRTVRSQKDTKRKARKPKERTVLKVSAYDPDTGELVTTYDSVQTAAVTLGLNPANIYMCCSGHAKTAGGLIWAYADSKKDDIQPVYATKRVDMYSRFGEKMMTFDSAADAAAYINENYGANVSVNGIRSACIGRSMTSGGFIWRYAGDTTGVDLFNAFVNRRYRGEQALRRVAQYNERGEWIRNWNSVTLAAEMVKGVNVHSIIDACEGRRVMAGRCRWKYI